MLSPAPLPPPPRWWVYALLPLLHYASVKLVFVCAASPEKEVVVWLPNAVLLAALLYWRGQRGWALAALAFASDLAANLPVFPALEALLFCLGNLGEVVLTWWLMRRVGASPGLERLQDFGKFVVAGPLVGSLSSSLFAGAVLKLMGNGHTSYSTLALLWWFGDALGLLIYTPMLLAFAQPRREAPPARWLDGAVVALTVALAALVLSGESERLGGVPLTPTLLLPSVLYMAVRFEQRWTSLAVAAIALATSWGQTRGHKPFGDAPAHELILRTQEFILTLSIVGMGFATLFSEQRTLTRSLEDKVRERTQELQELNGRLAALSATDGLTGIANRRRFDEALQAEWQRARRAGKPVALALLDVDLFKSYNDRYGHQAGDDCLKAIARLLAAQVHRADDLVARYGGEEFALIVSSVNSTGVIALARAICAALQADARPHASSPFGVVTVSIGVAMLTPGKDNGVERLIRKADEALYQAKANGRNQVVVAPA